METRAQEKLYLLDYDESQIVGAKLPSNEQVLRLLFYNLRKVKLSLRGAAYLVIEEVEFFWAKARIPTKNVDKSVLKLEGLYQEWKGLQKSSNRRTTTQENQEQDFVATFINLFDIAHADALQLITIEEDKLFLLSQRQEGRPGSMIGSDRVLLEKENRKLYRKAVGKRKSGEYLANIHGECKNPECTLTEDEGSENEQDDEDLSKDFDDLPRPSNVKNSRARINFITPELVTVLDKCKVSDRDAVRILIATAQALKHDVNDLILNRTFLRRYRSRFRVESAQKIYRAFKNQEITAVVVHWDGKILPSLINSEHVDRLPVVISFNGTEQLLGIPAISAGTGKLQASAIYNLLSEWGLLEKVQALCCDTTASNMGRFQGACIILEQKLERDILYLPCRHHILEIILRSIFEQKMQVSSGPGVQIFHRFKQSWQKINQMNFKCGVEDNYVKDTLVDASEIIEFALQNLNENQPREDYKELLQLVVVFLGGTVSQFVFRAPGAFHHARWMAKAIYCLKIFLFREEFNLSKYEEDGIRDICIFVAKVYLRAWTRTPVSAEAPRQDLALIKNLYAYRYMDETASQKLLHKLCNHLWYLTAEAAGFAFFDPQINNEIKKRMVTALKNVNDTEEKKLIVPSQDYSLYSDKSIEDFISQKTKTFFKRFGIPTDFLAKNPVEWKDESSYNIGLNIVNKINVVNDSAERAVKLMEDFNNVLSKNEEEKQFIVQTVAAYRKLYPDAKKSTLLQ